MVGTGARLGAPVLHDLQILGLAEPLGVDERLADGTEHRDEQLAADGLNGPMLTGRSHDGPPAPRSSGLRHRYLGQVSLHFPGFTLGTDDIEGVVLERPDANAFARRLDAVLAGPVVHGRGRQREAAALELAVDD